MSKEKAQTETPQRVEPATEHRGAPRGNPVSGVLIAAFAAVLLGGAAYGLSRSTRLESEFFSAISNCGATLLPIKGSPERTVSRTCTRSWNSRPTAMRSRAS